MAETWEETVMSESKRIEILHKEAENYKRQTGDEYQYGIVNQWTVEPFIQAQAEKTWHSRDKEIEQFAHKIQQLRDKQSELENKLSNIELAIEQARQEGIRKVVEWVDKN